MWVYRQLARKEAINKPLPRKAFVDGEGFLYLGRSYRLRLLPDEATDAAVKLQLARTIRTRLKDAVLLEGVHYIRPFGGRKLLFIWETIQRDIGTASAGRGPLIPMANGGVAHG